MSPNLTLVAVVGVLFAAGTFLLMERSLVRVMFGVILLGNGVNALLLVAAGPAGDAPLTGTTPLAQMSDSLPQALALTAIVITLGVTAFLLALTYRASVTLEGDEVQDDLEDQRVAAARTRDDDDEGDGQ